MTNFKFKPYQMDLFPWRGISFASRFYNDPFMRYFTQHKEVMEQLSTQEWAAGVCKLNPWWKVMNVS